MFSFKLKKVDIFSIEKSKKGDNIFDQVPEKKLDNVDFYVFLTYLPQNGENRLKSFKKEFLIIPTANLKEFVNQRNRE